MIKYKLNALKMAECYGTHSLEMAIHVCQQHFLADSPLAGLKSLHSYANMAYEFKSVKGKTKRVSSEPKNQETRRTEEDTMASGKPNQTAGTALSQQLQGARIDVMVTAIPGRERRHMHRPSCGHSLTP